jgi:hypothetical protein
MERLEKWKRLPVLTNKSTWSVYHVFKNKKGNENVSPLQDGRDYKRVLVAEYQELQ